MRCTARLWFLSLTWVTSYQIIPTERATLQPLGLCSQRIVFQLSMTGIVEEPQKLSSVVNLNYIFCKNNCHDAWMFTGHWYNIAMLFKVIFSAAASVLGHLFLASVVQIYLEIVLILVCPMSWNPVIFPLSVHVFSDSLFWLYNQLCLHKIIGHLFHLNLCRCSSQWR